MIKEVICNDNDISEAFDKFFANIIPNLKIISRKNLETTVECDVSKKKSSTKCNKQIQKSS